MKANLKLADLRSRFDQLFVYIGILLDGKKEQKEGGAGRQRRGKGKRGVQSTKSAVDLDVRSFVR